MLKCYFYFYAHYHPPLIQTASNHFLSLLQYSGVLPVLRRFCDIGIMLRSQSLFISLSFAPYHRDPFTPSFADGGVQRPALALFPPYLVESHLTPTPIRRILQVPVTSHTGPSERSSPHELHAHTGHPRYSNSRASGDPAHTDRPLF